MRRVMILMAALLIATAVTAQDYQIEIVSDAYKIVEDKHTLDTDGYIRGRNVITVSSQEVVIKGELSSRFSVDGVYDPTFQTITLDGEEIGVTSMRLDLTERTDDDVILWMRHFTSETAEFYVAQFIYGYGYVAFVGHKR